MRQIQVGKIYKHFKNKYYIVVDIVNDCETNNDEEYKKIVIYKALYGDYLTWARPYDVFNSEVDHIKYPNIKQKYRFEEVNFDNKEIKKCIQEYNILITSEIINLSNRINK